MRFLLRALPLLLVAASSAAGVPWNPRYAPALKLAKRSHKPLMVDFRASYCGPCKVMDRKVYIDPKITALSKRFTPVQLDVEAPENQALWKRFKTDVLPTIVFLSWDGKTILSKFTGYQDVPSLKSKMEAALKLAR